MRELNSNLKSFDKSKHILMHKEKKCSRLD